MNGLYKMDIEDYFAERYKITGLSGTYLTPLRPAIVVPAHRIRERVQFNSSKMPLEICITFRNELMIYESGTLMRLVKQRIERFLARHHLYEVKMILVLEHSETGRPHIHGMLGGIPADLMRVLRRNLTKGFGGIHLGMIKYTDSYVKYIFKSYIEEADRVNVPHNYYNLKIANRGYETWSNDRYLIMGLGNPEVCNGLDNDTYDLSQLFQES